MDKDKRLRETSWWERLTEGENGRGMLSNAARDQWSNAEDQTSNAEEEWRIAPEKLKRLNQSENSAQSWMWQMTEVKSDAIKNNIA